MNQKTLKIFFGLLILLLAGTAVYFVIVKKSVFIIKSSTKTTDLNQLPASNPSPTLPSELTVYENQFMKLAIPAGWTAKQANKTTYYGSCVNKENCTTTPKVEPNPAAVNVTKGNYILYINTQTSQASGVEGGRFGEIAGGAPSADAVVTEQPSPPCGNYENYPAFADRVRADLYVNNQEKNSYCAVPTNGSTVWYFSYITGPSGGYFNYYKPGQSLSYVITMAYNSKNVNSLPVKGSPELSAALNDMTAIAKSLEIKQQ